MAGAIHKAMRWSRHLLLFSFWFALAGYSVAEQRVFAFETYFDVGEVHVTDPSPRGEISLDTSAHALADFTGSYKVIGRDLRTGHAACEGPDSGPIPYASGSGYPAPPISMEWWEGPNGTCRSLPPGTYYLTTCWTVQRPAFLGPVTGCVRSNNFTVLEADQ